MVDQDLLRRKLSLLSRTIVKLERYRDVSLAELAGNEERRDAIERSLHVAVQACLDIGNHLIADLNLREPQDYKDIMVVLTEEPRRPHTSQPSPLNSSAIASRRYCCRKGLKSAARAKIRSSKFKIDENPPRQTLTGISAVLSAS